MLVCCYPNTKPQRNKLFGEILKTPFIAFLNGLQVSRRVVTLKKLRKTVFGSPIPLWQVTTHTSLFYVFSLFYNTHTFKCRSYIIKLIPMLMFTQMFLVAILLTHLLFTIIIIAAIQSHSKIRLYRVFWSFFL